MLLPHIIMPLSCVIMPLIRIIMPVEIFCLFSDPNIVLIQNVLLFSKFQEQI